MWLIALSGLSLGFIGSFHCVGMCGPIAVSLPHHQNSFGRDLTKQVLYNLGRVITYASFGVLFGFVGRGLFIGGVQQWISIALGSIILALVFFPSLLPGKWKSYSLFQLPWFKNSFSAALKIKSYFSYLLIGILNGLLPCGFVYMAISAAVLTTSVADGALFMAGFGIGTIPAMLGLSMMGAVVSLKQRNLIKRSMPIISALLGLVLIARGLNLGIPYISPKMNAGPQQTEMECCYK
jgi:uncharacterized protein